MIRRAIVLFMAWAFRRGVRELDMRRALETAFPHRDTDWRTEIVRNAQQRNRAKTMLEVS